ncbi:MAG TPA: DNA polymerase III subunit delta [Edaphocola sp.]|nr:DNA polymerase III subunit delta [Edaphocola sp.]
MKSFNDIIQEIDKGQLSPVYLLDGEEPYYIDRLLEKLESLVPEEEKDFNLITFYGKDCNWQEVVNAARQFPMFGERILVVLREAAQLKDINELSAYVSAPQSSTVLVIEHRFKKMDGRSKLPKLLDKQGVYFTSSKLKEEQVPEWIIQYCQANDSKIDIPEAQLIAANLGDDLQKIANELGKIWLNKEDGRDITAEKIEKYIGINREYNILELPNVLFDNNTDRLANMLNYFSANPKVAAMPALIGIFCSFLQKVYLAQFVPQNFTKDRQLGIWNHHRKVATRYAPLQIHKSIAVLEEFSHKSVGIDSANKDDLLREMIGKLQTLLRA